MYKTIKFEIKDNIGYITINRPEALNALNMDVLKDLESKAFLREYRSKCFILGKNIYVHPNLDKKSIRARAIDIDENGGLVVEYMEGRKIRQMETLTTGEVSIRLDE